MEEVGIRLVFLENNIRGTFDRGTDYELSECGNSINRALRNLEYTLGGYKVGTPAQVDRMLRSLENNLGEIKVLIEDSRDNEKRFTVENLQRISVQLEAAIEGLDGFEVEGIKPTGQDDIAYDEDVKQTIDKQIKSFMQEYGITDPRVAEEIRAEMNNLRKGLVRSHERVSVSMKDAIKAKVQEVGRDLVEEKEKTGRENTFADSLQTQTVPESELAITDAYELSENEKAFKGNEEPAKSGKSKYDDMFK